MIQPAKTMTRKELQSWVISVYQSQGQSYLKTAKKLSEESDVDDIDPMTIWRIIDENRDSPKLRRMFKIKKTNRVRICFDGTEEDRKWVNETIARVPDMTRSELFQDMKEIYIKHETSYW